MPKFIEGDLQARNARIGVVVSRFNDFITSHLVDAAIDTFKRHGGDPDQLTIVRVTGSYELPVAALRLAQSGQFDAIVALGCIVRGSTDHYDHVASAASNGIAKVGLETGLPVIFGVITADSLEQAIERAGSKQGNQGDKAMLAAIEMVNVFSAAKDAFAAPKGKK